MGGRQGALPPGPLPGRCPGPRQRDDCPSGLPGWEDIIYFLCIPSPVEGPSPLRARREDYSFLINTIKTCAQPRFTGRRPTSRRRSGISLLPSGRPPPSARGEKNSTTPRHYQNMRAAHISHAAGIFHIAQRYFTRPQAYFTMAQKNRSPEGLWFFCAINPRRAAFRTVPIRLYRLFSRHSRSRYRALRRNSLCGRPAFRSAPR